MLTRLSRSVISRSLSVSSAMASYQHFIQSAPDAEFPAESGRYHLYVTLSCPFACRALTARNLKGLEHVVGLSVAHPIFQNTKPNDDEDTHRGWAFVDPTKSTYTGANGQEYSTAGCTDDPIKHTAFVRDLYELVDLEPRRYTVPLLWDIKKDTIVNNESADMVRIFNSGFGDLATNTIDLVPTELESELDVVNNGFVQDIGSQFFKISFFAKAETVEEETVKFFEALAQAEAVLAKQRYLVGKTVTEADIRLFHTLIRADVHQRVSSKQSILDFPNVVNYLRDLYQMPAFKATVNWDHLKLSVLNAVADAPVPVGPTVDYEAAHDRKRFEL